MLRYGRIGTPIGVGLLVLAGLLVAWLARGLRPGDRGMLAGAYVLVTSVTFLTAVGDKAMLLHTPWTSSRYAFTPGVLVLVMLLGCVRRGAGALRAALCAVLLGFAMVRGAMQYPGSVRWKPSWPLWSDQVRAWEVNPQRPLRSGRRRGRCRFPPRRRSRARRLVTEPRRVAGARRTCDNRLPWLASRIASSPRTAYRSRCATRAAARPSCSATASPSWRTPGATRFPRSSPAGSGRSRPTSAATVTATVRTTSPRTTCAI